METFEYRGCTVTVDHDEFAENPRDFDCNLGTMIYTHPRYVLGDKQCTPETIHDALDSFGPDAIVLPLYLYDHSGITMSTTPFSCPWDSGQVGYICVSMDTVCEEYGEVNDETIVLATQCLQDEVETFDQYISGEVYCIKIDFPDGETETLCGLFGWEYVNLESRDMIDYALDNKP
jgi:hypothetical protein